MADLKYGRLFTEEDVVAFTFLSSGEEPELIRDRLQGCQTTFPDDEPLFLMRGKDKCAPGAIAGGPICYEDACQSEGASEEHLDSVRQAANEMREWQAANRDRVKIPD